jgi:hypothetical protein
MSIRFGIAFSAMALAKSSQFWINLLEILTVIQNPAWTTAMQIGIARIRKIQNFLSHLQNKSIHTLTLPLD